MRSLKSRFINLLLKSFGAKKMFASFNANVDSAEGFQAAVDQARAAGDYSSEPPEKLAQKYPTEMIDVDGFGLTLLEVGANKKVVYFLHGGAYVLGIGKVHWDFMEKVGKSADCHVAVFDYPIAPEFKAETAVDRSQKAFEVLVERYGAENVVLMGGSAGAGLAMGLSLKLRDEDKPQPSKVILLYPWLDVTMSHSEARGLEDKDLLLEVDGLIACGQHYAGDLGVEHPYVSPWFGSLENLPPTKIFTGSWDVLHPEGRDFAKKLKGAGNQAELFVYDQMQHAWLLFDMPESKKGLTQITNLIGV